MRQMRHQMCIWLFLCLHVLPPHTLVKQWTCDCFGERMTKKCHSCVCPLKFICIHSTSLHSTPLTQWLNDWKLKSVTRVWYSIAANANLSTFSAFLFPFFIFVCVRFFFFCSPQLLSFLFLNSPWICITSQVIAYILYVVVDEQCHGLAMS